MEDYVTRSTVGPFYLVLNLYGKRVKKKKAKKGDLAGYILGIITVKI